MTKTTKPIEFDKCVRPIDDEPLLIGRRLDFAKWLSRNGYRNRADWIRENCGQCEYHRSLFAQHSSSETVFEHCSSDFWGNLDIAWKRIRPEWWPEFETEDGSANLVVTPSFGRVIVWTYSVAPQQGYEGQWLRRAFNDGWLEIVRAEPSDEGALDSLVRIPDEYKDLPLFLDTTRTRCERAPNRQMEAILEYSGLRGVVFHTTELSLNSVKEFSTVARRLQYLQVLGLRSNSRTFAIEQLCELPRLRSLTVSKAHPDDQTIEHIISADGLQFLKIESSRLTDKGLLKLVGLKNLRFLALDADKVSRSGIEELREALPAVTIQVEGMTRWRMGPV